jgi:hypothetical protein
MAVYGDMKFRKMPVCEEQIQAENILFRKRDINKTNFSGFERQLWSDSTKRVLPIDGNTEIKFCAFVYFRMIPDVSFEHFHD